MRRRRSGFSLKNRSHTRVRVAIVGKQIFLSSRSSFACSTRVSASSIVWGSEQWSFLLDASVCVGVCIYCFVLHFSRLGGRHFTATIWLRIHQQSRPKRRRRKMKQKTNRMSFHLSLMSAREKFPTIRETEKTMATVNDFGKVCSEGETTPFEIAQNWYSDKLLLPGISFRYFWHCGFHFFATSSLIRSARRPLNYVESRATHVRRFGSFRMPEKYWSAVENKFFRFLVMKSVLNVWEIAILSFKISKGEKSGKLTTIDVQGFTIKVDYSNVSK